MWMNNRMDHDQLANRQSCGHLTSLINKSINIDRSESYGRESWFLSFNYPLDGMWLLVFLCLFLTLPWV